MGEVVDLRGRYTLEEVQRLGLPMSWTDPSGITHACTGKPNPTLIHTLCLLDVPPNEAEVPSAGEPGSAIDCPACQALHYPEREEGLKTLPFTPPEWKAE